MRATTSRLGPASSSGSLNGCTDSATPATSSSSRCSSAFGAVTSYGTPCTSSRASTIPQPALASVTGSSSFLMFVSAVWTIFLPRSRTGLAPAGSDQARSGNTARRLLTCLACRNKLTRSDRDNTLVRGSREGNQGMADTRWQNGAALIRYPDPDIKVLDPRFQKYVLGNAAIERIAGGGRFTEGPVWFGDGRYLLWSDIPNNRIMKWEEETGAISVFRRPSNWANGNTRDRQGRLVTCEH